MADIPVTKMFKNPILKAAVYILTAMIIGIGGLWVLLGVLSPIMLVLLLLKW